MASSKTVDKINVDGVDYAVSFETDPTPIEGSPLPVQSGGVYEYTKNRGDTAAQNSGIFTRQGAFDYFLGSTSPEQWYGKVFGHAYGRTWTKATRSDGYTTFTSQKDAIYFKGLYVTVGAGSSGRSFWSEDGKVFTEAKIGSSGTCNYLATDGNVLVCGDTNTSTSTRGIMYSEDGKTWAQALSAQGFSVYYIVYLGGKFIAMGKDIPSAEFRVYCSENGKDWSLSNWPSTCALDPFVATSQWLIAYHSGVYVMACLGSSGTYGTYWSNDGTHWTRGLTTTYALRRVQYVNGLFFALPASSSYMPYWSTDGKNWTVCTGVSEGFHLVAYGRGIWVAAGTGKKFWSNDGKTWNAATTDLSGNNPVLLMCLNGRFVVGHGGNTVYGYSNDGKNWYQATVAPSTTLGYSNFVNGLLLVAPNSGGIYYSNDGISYAQAATIPNATMMCPKFMHGKWLALNGGIYWTGLEQFLDSNYFSS